MGVEKLVITIMYLPFSVSFFILLKREFGINHLEWGCIIVKRIVLTCKKCRGAFEVDGSLKSGLCPFCGTVNSQGQESHSQTIQNNITSGFMNETIDTLARQQGFVLQDSEMEKVDTYILLDDFENALTLLAKQIKNNPGQVACYEKILKTMRKTGIGVVENTSTSYGVQTTKYEVVRVGYKAYEDTYAFYLERLRKLTNQKYTDYSLDTFVPQILIDSIHMRYDSKEEVSDEYSSYFVNCHKYTLFIGGENDSVVDKNVNMSIEGTRYRTFQKGFFNFSGTFCFRYWIIQEGLRLGNRINNELYFIYDRGEAVCRTVIEKNYRDAYGCFFAHGRYAYYVRCNDRGKRYDFTGCVSCELNIYKADFGCIINDQLIDQLSKDEMDKITQFNKDNKCIFCGSSRMNLFKNRCKTCGMKKIPVK